METLRDFLDECYARYNTRAHAHSDPVSFLYRYEDPMEREVGGLVAALLAYGRLRTIMQKVAQALGRLGPRPRAFLLENDRTAVQHALAGFVHRRITGAALAEILWMVRGAIERRGSLQACFVSHIGPADKTVMPALDGWVRDITGDDRGVPHILPVSASGSACKRLCLYLRWMVRCDQVDPGGWDAVSPARLVIPIDAHMLKVGRALGFTRRRTASRRAALEVTSGMSAVNPDDPTRCDFALTHTSMAEGAGLLERLQRMGVDFADHRQARS